MTIRPPDSDFVPSDKDSSVLTPEARKILKRWARQGYYVYLRPTMSAYAGDDGNRVYWMLSVEYREINFTSIRGEGYNLSKLIVAVSGRVHKRPNRTFKLGDHAGWLAPKVAFEAEKKAIHEKLGPEPCKHDDPDKIRKVRKKDGTKLFKCECGHKWPRPEKGAKVIPFERPRKRKRGA